MSGWGGKREGAGAKPKRSRYGSTHVPVTYRVTGGEAARLTRHKRDEESLHQAARRLAFERIVMIENLRYYWQNPRLSHKYNFRVVQSEIWEKRDADFLAVKMPLVHLIRRAWESLRDSLKRIQAEREDCIVFNGPLVFRAEREANLVFFWVEAQISHDVRQWHNDEEAHPLWSEDDYLERFGCRFLVPNDIWPLLELDLKVLEQHSFWIQKGAESEVTKLPIPGFQKLPPHPKLQQIKDVAKFCEDADDLVAWALLLNDQGNMSEAWVAFKYNITPDKEEKYIAAIQSAWNIMNLAKLKPNQGIAQTHTPSPSEFHAWLLTYINARDRELPLPLCIANGMKTCRVKFWREWYPEQREEFLREQIERTHKALKDEGLWPPRYKLDA